MPNESVCVDGSYGEGGGQILRTSLALAALTGKPVEISNIRAGRPKPGLQAQHLTAVQAIAEICDASLEGAEIGSTRLIFTPQCKPRAGRYHFSIGTAGATSLVVQAIFLPLAFASSTSQITITGGTHVPFAPVAEYLQNVYFRALESMGIKAHCSYQRAGFYPKGGGQLDLKIETSNPIRPLFLPERGSLLSVKAFIITSELPTHVAERGMAAVEQFMQSTGHPIDIKRINCPSSGPGASVVITAECERGFGGFSALGERGKPIERVASEACEAFLSWWKSNTTCDEHLSDQLVLPAAFAPGMTHWSTPRITEHLRTVIWVTRLFLPTQVALEERSPGGPAIVTIHGVE